MQQLQDTIEKMLSRELKLGGRASFNYNALEQVQKKGMVIDGFRAELHFNPARVASVMAKVDEKTLRERKCFLCPSGLEQMQQSHLWKCSGDTEYFLRVNPFPIFERHFTISTAVHCRQEMAGHYRDMLEFATLLPDYDIFYNGPKCGASAPDHMHFQACPKDSLPAQKASDEAMDPVVEENGCQEKQYSGTSFLSPIVPGIYRINKYVRGAYLLLSSTCDRMEKLFSLLMEARSFAGYGRHTEFTASRIYWEGDRKIEDEWEPRMNILTWRSSFNAEYRTIVYFREESRPACFFDENPEKRILISPASVEMSGIAIVSSEDSFDKLNAGILADVIKEVSLAPEKCGQMELFLKMNG